MSESNIPRRRRWWLPIAIATAVLTALAAWWSTQLSPMARLRASGAPVTFEDLVPPDTPTEGNAAATLEGVFSQLESLPNRVYELASESTERTLSERELLEAGGLLASAKIVFDAIDQATDESLYVPIAMRDIDVKSVHERVSPLRSLQRLSTLRTRVAIAEGRCDDALDSAIALLRVAKLVEREPTITGRLVACAIQQVGMLDALAVAGACPLSDEDSARFDTAFASIEDRSGFGDTLISERVFALQQLNQMPFPTRLWERPGVLRLFESAIDQSRAIGSGDRFQARGGRVLASLALPGLQACFDAENRVVALARCARIRLALRDAASDSVTTGDALSLPATALLDPFGGEPLIVVHREATPENEAGWWVYSVGVNLTDDGGKFDDASDFGFDPPKIPIEGHDAAAQ